MTQHISDEGLKLIKRWEGWFATAYRCPADVWTIGWGHTATAREGMKITKPEGEALLRADVVRAEQGVAKAVKVPLTQAQFDALVSWWFNCNMHNACARSTLVRELNKGRYDAVPAQLMRWRFAGGRVLQGLVNRRRDECALWRSSEPHHDAKSLPGRGIPKLVETPPQPSFSSILRHSTTIRSAAAGVMSAGAWVVTEAMGWLRALSETIATARSEVAFLQVLQADLGLALPWLLPGATIAWFGVICWRRFEASREGKIG